MVKSMFWEREGVGWGGGWDELGGRAVRHNAMAGGRIRRVENNQNVKPGPARWMMRRCLGT